MLTSLSLELINSSLTVVFISLIFESVSSQVGQYSDIFFQFQNAILNTYFSNLTFSHICWSSQRNKILIKFALQSMIDFLKSKSGIATRISCFQSIICHNVQFMEFILNLYYVIQSFESCSISFTCIPLKKIKAMNFLSQITRIERWRYVTLYL